MRSRSPNPSSPDPSSFHHTALNMQPSGLPSPSQTPPLGGNHVGVDFGSDLRGAGGGCAAPVSRAEAIKGLSNRFVFSTFYVWLYLGMALLSCATVFLSLTSDCPGFWFYVLEFIVNTTMIAEVTIRLLAFGKQFWKSYYNTLDLFITAFCFLTLLVLFSSGCSAKGEEVFDIVLLVARNLFQFGRLALVMRKSGKNVFTRPAPIDLSSAREYSYSLDLDLDDEEGELAERRAMGGDVEAQRGGKGRGGRAEERPFTLDDGSDED